ncbi:STM4015 family protein [Planomonospora parontospora]|uniref:STM4015 family protein n=1 Tax=Planomonospora parontospora TaxID=58119 RepID=UPI0027DD63F9|nr:STM4015 family protein [Planomonospora parontospora]
MSLLRNPDEGLSRFASLPMSTFAHSDGPGDGPLRAEAWRLWHNYVHSGRDVSYEGYFAGFVESVDTETVRELVLGCWGSSWEDSAEEPIGLLTQVADRFPNLRLIALGDIPSDEAEISWIRQGDLTPLLGAFPRLEVLEVRGGEGLGLRPLAHDSLRALRVESGGLDGAVVRAVGGSDLPALEHLELWLGVSDYGGDATVADLEGILSGDRLPALRHLGLQDSEIQDEIAAAVASAPVVARLESLALSMGTLSDAGAEALLTGQPLTHLRTLDLRHHYVSPSMAERLAGALPRTAVLLGEARKPYDFDPDGRYVAVSE